MVLSAVTARRARQQSAQARHNRIDPLGTRQSPMICANRALYRVPAVLPTVRHNSLPPAPLDQLPLWWDDRFTKQNGCLCIAFVEHLAGIQQHRAFSDVGKRVLDLTVLHDALIRHGPSRRRDLVNAGYILRVD
jgi:hypothetical protein